MFMTMTVASGILNMLGAVFPPPEASRKSSVRQFVPKKQLSERDSILVDMLNSQGHEDVCYCVCDPDLPDMPIIFASEGFCNFTGYGYNEIEGRNCRFLQGPETKRQEVDGIREAIQKEVERSVNLLNYRKDGTPFVNEFFISPLRDENKKLQYVRQSLMSTCILFVRARLLTQYHSCYVRTQFIGVQCEVPKKGKGQMPSNIGWVYTQGNHV
jgi:PAS domain S-box-containing protein